MKTKPKEKMKFVIYTKSVNGSQKIVEYHAKFTLDTHVSIAAEPFKKMPIDGQQDLLECLRHTLRNRIVQSCRKIGAEPCLIPLRR